ncbi:MAG: hypothetical protein QME51_03935 [Planctomycetota bacterium]|nr:hypothetical protein [Planctomycetota bacterium]
MPNYPYHRPWQQGQNVATGSSGDIENLDWERLWGEGWGVTPPQTVDGLALPNMTMSPTQMSQGQSPQPAGGGSSLWNRLGRGGTTFLKSVQMGPELTRQWAYERATTPAKMRMMAAQKLMEREREMTDYQKKADIGLTQQKAFLDYQLANPKTEVIQRPTELTQTDTAKLMELLTEIANIEYSKNALLMKPEKKAFLQEGKQQILDELNRRKGVSGQTPGQGITSPAPTAPRPIPAMPTAPITATRGAPIAPQTPQKRTVLPEKNAIYEEIMKLRAKGVSDTEIADMIRQQGGNPIDYGLE